MSDSEFETFVILPAGGSGERMNLSQPKQYINVRGQPVFMYTLQAFHSISWVKHIFLCVSDQYKETVRRAVHQAGMEKVTVVTAGCTRHRSIQCGVRTLLEFGVRSNDVVVIHDAVRPFLTQDLLRQVTAMAHIHGAAGVTRPLVSTVIQTDGDGFLVTSLNRRHYRASEMPQAFSYSIIKQAYDKCSEDDLDYGTECLLLAQKYTNARVRLIDGPDYLWKVTHHCDLHTMEACLQERDCVVELVDVPEEIQEFLHDQFTKRHVRYVSRNTDDPVTPYTTPATSLVVFSRHAALTCLNTPTQQRPSCLIHAVMFDPDLSVHDFYARYAKLLRESSEKVEKTRTNIVVLLQARYDHLRLVSLLCDLISNQCPSLDQQVLSIS